MEERNLTRKTLVLILVSLMTMGLLTSCSTSGSAPDLGSISSSVTESGSAADSSAHQSTSDEGASVLPNTSGDSSEVDSSTIGDTEPLIVDDDKVISFEETSGSGDDKKDESSVSGEDSATDKETNAPDKTDDNTSGKAPENQSGEKEGHSSGSNDYFDNRNPDDDKPTVAQRADPNTGISWDGVSPIIYTYPDGTTGTNPVNGATYEVVPGVTATYMVYESSLPDEEQESGVFYCDYCGRVDGNGANDTCVRWMTGGNHTCPSCGATVPGNTCHNCDADKAADTQEQQPAHTHAWEAVYDIIHHAEVGHYETQVVTEAWDEPVYESKAICSVCGAGFDAADDALNHIFDVHDGGGSYSVNKIQTSTIHHDAVTEQAWVVDTAAYDEQVLAGYVCDCGESTAE